MNTVYLSLGSNEGDRIALIKEALMLLNGQCGNVTTVSKVYETAAWGNEAQPDFLNIAVKLFTNLDPILLLDAIHIVENHLGRERTKKWGQRTLDIDILFYNNEVISEERLTIPHPRLHQRLFVLIPLSEIAPTFVHPIMNKTVTELLSNCEDHLPVRLSALQL